MKRYVSALILVGLLSSILAIKCYRDMSAAQRKLDKADEYRAAGNHDAAALAYEDALKLGADRRRCLVGIAESYLYLGKLDSCLEATNKLRSIPDGRAEGHYYRALVFDRQSRRADYLKELEIAKLNGSRYASILLSEIASESK